MRSRSARPRACRGGGLALAALLASCSGVPAQHPDAAAVVPTALAMQGRPYRYGGDSPAGFDCSGLVYYSFTRHGIAVPRDSRSQLQRSRPVPRAALQAGDLVFFDTGSGSGLHVGIYLNRSRFIHAPSRGGTVSIASLDDGYWGRHFLRGGRVR